MVSERDFDNVTLTEVVTAMHCKGFLETWLMFEVPAPFIPFLPSSAYTYQYFKAKSDCGRCGKSA